MKNKIFLITCTIHFRRVKHSLFLKYLSIIFISKIFFIDIKPRVVNSIYNKLDDLAIRELYKTKLGGEDAVVLSEMYPDCLNRLSPDTTDQPHVHRILMIADTKVRFIHI